ncbi:hypothetical protein EQW78_08350 [Oerskovia turbata]|uniref:Uncharacterized protein n=1 Tax=Oerskovia turbata TaxID=1713 RepID=A0A4Q1KWB2_9CELL|nr:hypothetical protein [Oerskovia turbata]RXR26820.1 hypothetical protein EQW73_04855 [Oerskovia turbata]RXR34553.1 hypothetical protein EQW78_08350 [Oerskovia turbata]TGJ97830.1 hypothetical protein DLJ96_07965 [Actinotalea fermentans ATCC 43279 = JCM 9966 = DSM 3133]
MSTTLSPEAVILDQVRRYAADVRAHLADLSPEQVDDLTDGLEADLAEALADMPGALRPLPQGSEVPDGGATALLDVTERFGPAAEYAAELRSAAGLDPAAPGPRPRRTLGDRLAADGKKFMAEWKSLWAPVTSTPQWSTFCEFAAVLRPVWWVLRAWVVVLVLYAWLISNHGFELVPQMAVWRLVLVLAIVVSVQWGRGRWLRWRGLDLLRKVVNVLAVLVAVPFFVSAAFGANAELNGLPTSSSGSYDRGYQQGVSDASNGYGASGVSTSGAGSGVFVDGSPVSNLFVYDASGRALQDVQIFDDQGRPVRTIAAEGASQPWTLPGFEQGWYFQPSFSTDGRERWNVYPLRGLPEDAVEWDGSERPVPLEGEQPRSMPSPFLQAQPLLVPSTTGGTPTPAPDAAPDAGTAPADPGTPVDPQAPTGGEPPAGQGVDGTTAPSARVPGAPSPATATPVLEASTGAAPSGG